jgi:hypothetical protein
MWEDEVSPLVGTGEEAEGSLAPEGEEGDPGAEALSLLANCPWASEAQRIEWKVIHARAHTLRYICTYVRTYARSLLTRAHACVYFLGVLYPAGAAIEQ